MITLGSIQTELEEICARTGNMINEAFVMTGDSKCPDNNDLTLEFRIARLTALYLLSKGFDSEIVKEFMANHDWFLPIDTYKRQS